MKITPADKILNILQSKYFFLALSLVAGLVIVISYFHRFIDVDDAWLGKQAYWLAKDGHVHSELFYGRAGYEDQMVIYHKLWILLGALVTRLAGWSVFALKSLGALSWAGLIFLVYNFLRKNNYSWNQIAVALVVLLSHHLLVYYSFTFRPEILTATLGLGSFFFLQKWVRSRQNSHLILAGLLAGLAAFTHLNGLIFIFAGVITLWGEKYWKAGFMLGLAALVGFIPFFWDVFTHPELFWPQLGAVSTSDKPPLHFLIDLVFRLVYEQIRYFHSPVEFSFTLLWGMAVYIGWRQFTTDPAQKRQLIYTGLLMLCLTFLAPDKTTKYSILLLPFFTLLIAEIWGNLGKQSPLKKYGLIFLFIGFLGIQWGFSLWKASKNFPEVSFNQSVLKHFQIPEKAGIIAPVNFVFPGILNHTIKGLKYYEWQARDTGRSVRLRTILSDAGSHHYEYIIMPEKFLRGHLINLREELPPEFTYMGEKDGFHVVKGNLRLVTSVRPE